MNKFSELIKIGTCSWKYSSWKGILYSNGVGSNYLSEHAKHYNTVEIDQWFWSLFARKRLFYQNRKWLLNIQLQFPVTFNLASKSPMQLH